MPISRLRASGLLRHRTVISAVSAAMLGALCGLVAVGQLGAAGLIVSQRGRAFQPASLTVTRGDTVTFVNDDSDLLHHVFIDAPNFAFDSGDQEPGSRASVTFTERGSFQVMCGIHPKMKLPVRVN